MADDVSLSIGFDNSELSRATREAQQKIIAAVKELEQGISSSVAGINKEFSKLSSSVGKASKDISDAVKPANKAGSALDDLGDSAESAGGKLDKIRENFSRFAESAREVGNNIGNVADTIQSIAAPLSRLSGVLLAAQGILQAYAISAGRDAYQASVDFQSAVISLDKVLTDADGPVEQFAAANLQLSRELGVSATAALAATANYKQAGFQAKEALDLTRQAIVLADVGDLSPEIASQLLVQSIKGFRAEAADATTIIDILNEVSNQYAATLGELAIGFAQLSPVAQTAGLNFQETAALLTPVIEVFGSGTEAATALRTSLIRLTSDTKEVREGLASVFVSQTDANGAARSGKDIFLDFAFALQKLSKEQQLIVAGQVVGTNQADKFLAAIQGLDKIVAISGDNFKFAGSAIEEFSKRQKSAETTIKRTTEAFNNLNIAVGNQFQESLTGVIKSLGLVGNELEQQTTKGGFNGFFAAIRGRLLLLRETLDELANSIPNALKQVDFSTFSRGLDGLFGQFLRLRITSDGLASAINTAGQAFEGLSNFVGGIKDVFAVVVGAVGQAVAAFGRLPTSIQRFVGILGGASIVLNNFRFASLGLASALVGLKGLFVIIPGIIAGVAGSEAARVRIAKFAGAAGVGGLIASLLELSGLTDIIPDFIKESNSIEQAANAGNVVGDEFKQAFSDAISGEGVSGFADTVKEIFTSIGATVLPVIKEIGRIIGETFSAIPEALATADLSAFKEGFLSIFGVDGGLSSVSITAADVRGAIEGLGDAFKGSVEVIKILAGALKDLFAGFLELPPEAQASIIGIVGGLTLFSDALQGAGGAAQIFGPGIAGIFNLIPSPVKIVAVGIALGVLIEKFTGLGSILNDVLAPDFIFGSGETIGSVAAAFVQDLSAFIEVLEKIPGKVKEVGNTIQDFLAPDAIFGEGATLGSALADIVEAFENIKKKAAETLTAVADFLVPDFIENLFGDGTANVPPAVGAVDEFSGAIIGVGEAVRGTNGDLQEFGDKTTQTAAKVQQSQTQIANAVTQSQAQIGKAIADTALAQGKAIRLDEIALRVKRQLATETEAQAIQTALAESSEEDKNKKLLDLKQQLLFAEKSLKAAQNRLVAFNAQEERKAAQEVLRAHIDARQDELSDARAKLSEIKREEKQAAEDIIRIRNELATRSIRTEERINELRRSRLKGQALDNRLVSDALSADLAARQKIAEAARLQDAKAREAAFAEAKRQNELASTLAGQVQNISRATSFLRIFGTTADAISQAEIKSNEKTIESSKEKTDEQKKQIKTLEENIKELKDQLKGVKKTIEDQPKLRILDDIDEQKKNIADIQTQIETLQTAISGSPLKIRVDTSEAEKQINELTKIPELPPPIPIETADEAAVASITSIEKRLLILSKGITIPVKVDNVNNLPGLSIIRNMGGIVPNIPRFAIGGRVTGPAGTDKISAFLSQGEWVIRNQAVRYYGNEFMNAINSMQIPKSLLAPLFRIPSFPMPKAKPAPQHFATGGPAVASRESDFGTVNINFGRESLKVRTDRQGARDLVDLFGRLARAG